MTSHSGDVALNGAICSSLRNIRVILFSIHSDDGNLPVSTSNSTAVELGEGSGNPTEPQHTSTTVSLSNLEPITVLSQSLPKKTQKPSVSLNFIESIKEARSCVQDLTSGEIVSLNFIELIKEARSCVQDLTSGEIVSLNLLSR
ncbi:hypothetical protein Tco_0711670 [Tanacetum coccineum]